MSVRKCRKRASLERGDEEIKNKGNREMTAKRPRREKSFTVMEQES